MMTQMTDLVFAQLESLADDDDRSKDECRLLKIHLRELKSEFARLSKIEEAAERVAQQTSAERAYILHNDLRAYILHNDLRAYILHNDLIAALEVPNVELRGRPTSKLETEK